MNRPARKPVAAVLAAALSVTAPGLGAYEAWGQAFRASGAAASVPALPGGPLALSGPAFSGPGIDAGALPMTGGSMTLGLPGVSPSLPYDGAARAASQGRLEANPEAQPVPAAAHAAEAVRSAGAALDESVFSPEKAERSLAPLFEGARARDAGFVPVWSVSSAVLPRRSGGGRSHIDLGLLERPGYALGGRVFRLAEGESLRFSVMENQIQGLGSPRVDGVPAAESRALEITETVVGTIDGRLGKKLRHDYVVRANAGAAAVSRHVVEFPGTHQSRTDAAYAFSFEVQVFGGPRLAAPAATGVRPAVPAAALPEPRDFVLPVLTGLVSASGTALVLPFLGFTLAQTIGLAAVGGVGVFALRASAVFSRAARKGSSTGTAPAPKRRHSAADYLFVAVIAATLTTTVAFVGGAALYPFLGRLTLLLLGAYVAATVYEGMRGGRGGGSTGAWGRRPGGWWDHEAYGERRDIGGTIEGMFKAALVGGVGLAAYVLGGMFIASPLGTLAYLGAVVLGSAAAFAAAAGLMLAGALILRLFIVPEGGPGPREAKVRAVVKQLRPWWAGALSGLAGAFLLPGAAHLLSVVAALEGFILTVFGTRLSQRTGLFLMSAAQTLAFPAAYANAGWWGIVLNLAAMYFPISLALGPGRKRAGSSSTGVLPAERAGQGDKGSVSAELIGGVAVAGSVALFAMAAFGKAALPGVAFLGGLVLAVTGIILVLAGLETEENVRREEARRAGRGRGGSTGVLAGRGRLREALASLPVALFASTLLFFDYAPFVFAQATRMAFFSATRGVEILLAFVRVPFGPLAAPLAVLLQARWILRRADQRRAQGYTLKAALRSAIEEADADASRDVRAAEDRLAEAREPRSNRWLAAAAYAYTAVALVYLGTFVGPLAALLVPGIAVALMAALRAAKGGKPAEKGEPADPDLPGLRVAMREAFLDLRGRAQGAMRDGSSVEAMQEALLAEGAAVRAPMDPRDPRVAAYVRQWLLNAEVGATFRVRGSYEPAAYKAAVLAYLTRAASAAAMPGTRLEMLERLQAAVVDGRL